MAIVLETMRSLPVGPLAGLPSFVLGFSVIRGEMVPVVDLGAILGAAGRETAKRLVAVRSGGRRIALAVESVLGVVKLDHSVRSGLPSLAGQAHPDLLTAIGTLDQQFLLVVQAGAVVPPEVWAALAVAGADR